MKTAITALALAIAGAAGADAQTFGAKPSYLESLAPSVPNEAAIGRRIFVPELEEGWIPQGLAVVGEHVLVSSYKPTPDVLKDSKGPCRVYRLSMATGALEGRFDVPPESCDSHAGGLAYLGGNDLVIADTAKLSRVELDKALAAGTAAGAIRTVKISGLLRGSFAASQGRDAWTGYWSKDAGKSRMYKLPAGFFEATTVMDEKAAVEARTVPLEAQGAAFDRDGALWVTASRGNKMSKLYRLDAAGRVVAEHDMPMGLEGIAFGADGKLWAVSESGTRKYQRWGAQFHFPFVFEIDVSKLR